MTNNQIVISIILIAIVTMGIRFLPFIIFRKMETPKWLNRLGDNLPYAAIGMLVIYCMKELTFTSVDSYLPTIIAIVIVGASYIYKRNTLISIVSGTVSYMIMIQFIFV